MLDLQIQDLPRIEDIVGVKRPLYALHVDGDREQLRMVFGNIATNAIQAMEGKGTLTVTVRRTADGQVSPNCR